MRGLAALVLVLCVFAAPQACTNETILLGQIPPTDAGTIPPPPSRCVVGASPCTDGYYCSVSACGTSTGTCVPFPITCDATEQPVCGCDNITYFNDCLRQAYGVAASTPNPCPQEGACGGPSGAMCPAGTYCAQLAPPHGPCGHDIPGTCWVLPPHCPTATPANYWDSCDDMGGGGGVCLDTCSAIQAGGPYHRSEQCP